MLPSRVHHLLLALLPAGLPACLPSFPLQAFKGPEESLGRCEQVSEARMSN